MRRSFAAAVLAAAFLTSACVDGPSLGSRAQPPEVTISPTRPGGAARVTRLEVSSRGDVPLDPEELWLFAGELSDYHLARINRRELPATLSERNVPVRFGSDLERHHVMVVPNVVLTPGERYTLVAPGWGELARFDVDPDDPTPLLERVWPPVGAAVDRKLVVCAAEMPASPFEVALDFAGLSARVEPNFGVFRDGESCAAVSLPEGARGLGPLGLASEASGVLLDPTPFECESSGEPAAAVCSDDELTLGPGCARVEDDRVRVRSAGEPLLWGLDGQGVLRLEPGVAGAQWTVHALVPDSEQRLRGLALSVGGLEMRFDVLVRTLPARPHLVINEVLANPLGSEPAAEWVELVNDGQVAAELGGLWLRDSAGAVELPRATLQPAEYALLVRSDFPAFSGGDVPPAADTQLVALSTLAKGGLANSGEPLQLEDASGAVLSRFPALPARHAGVSVARARPDSPDDDLAAFAEHRAPGASPGAENY